MPGMVLVAGTGAIGAVVAPNAGQSYEVALLSAAVGASLACAAVERQHWLRARAAVGQRVCLDIAALALGSCILAGVALAAQCAWSMAQERSSLDALRGLDGLGVAAGQLVFLGVLLLRLRLPRRVASLLLPLVWWIAIAHLDQRSAVWTSTIAHGASLSPHVFGSWSAGIAAFGPMLVMLLAGLLIDGAAERGS